MTLGPVEVCPGVSATCLGISVHIRRGQDMETALRGASGRDLVIAKAAVVEAELAKLGLQLRARARPGKRRVLEDACELGHKAGLGFEYTPGIGDDQ